jgi:tetratricopeptide (TPR) repeat protein
MHRISRAAKEQSATLDASPRKACPSSGSSATMRASRERSTSWERPPSTRKTTSERSTCTGRRSPFRAGDAAGSTANLGYVALLQGDNERAAALFEDALVLFRERRHTSGVCVSLGNLAEAELGLGRQEEARFHLAECLELGRDAQFLVVIAQCLETAAALLLEAGDAETAARLTGAEDALLKEINVSLHPAERRRSASLRADLRARLGTSAEELRDEGRQLTADDASALALEALSTTAQTRG